MLKKAIFVLLVISTVFFECKKTIVNPDFIAVSDSILMPEKLIATDEFSGMYAQYIYPTMCYNHAVLGDETEGGGLLVNFNKKQFVFELDSLLVFEDLQPRLTDIDMDGVPEIITILSNINLGAGIAIYKIENEQIALFASNDFIGTKYRWLNIAAINDLDNDGEVEIAFVTTPHIDGNLHLARIENNRINVFASISGVSNHKIGSRNLCLSIVSLSKEKKILYVPNNKFDAVLGFQLQNKKLIAVDTIRFMVNPHISLSEQFQFPVVHDKQQCINAE